MSTNQSDLRELFALARAERASDDAKDRVRKRVLETAAVGVGVGATTAAVGSSIWKSALFGKLLGGLLLLGAVGGGLSVHAQVSKRNASAAVVNPTPRIAPERASAPSGAAAAADVKPDLELPEAQGASIAKPQGAALAPAPSKAALPPVQAATEATLEREAALLSEARTAMQQGDYAAAHTALTARKQLPSRSLDPEALVMEAKLLKAQGDPDASNAREAELRLRFPGHSLAR
jgi:hypothetical protein